MNFKKIVFICFLLVGCGVKGPPIPPEGSKIPSYIDQYLEDDKTEDE